MTDGLDFLQPTDDTRARAFEATLGVVRRRRWTRRACAALILAAVYAAGVATPAVFGHRAEPARTEPSTIPQPVTTPLRAPDLESRALAVNGRRTGTPPQGRGRPLPERDGRRRGRAPLLPRTS